MFSKASGQATAVDYFVQEAPGGERKAAVERWVATAAPVPLDTENLVKFTGLSAQLRKTAVGAVGRDAAGAAALSATADADRAVCERFADHKSFTTPDEPEDDRRGGQGTGREGEGGPTDPTTARRSTPRARAGSSDAQLSLTALIELPPAGTPGPAQAPSCNCVEPQLLEVTAKRAG
ncbi:hypothetical protein [Streptomyces sp. NPDC056544]|uniref:hypothetical protein n=1 Tax=unclassified Streptomyces TaxID=2593676 RepID=UPI00367388AD